MGFWEDALENGIFYSCCLFNVFVRFFLFFIDAGAGCVVVSYFLLGLSHWLLYVCDGVVFVI